MRNTFHKPGLVALGVLLLGSMTAACTLMKPSYDDLAGGDDPALPDASYDVSEPETSVDAQPDAAPDDSAPDSAQDDAADDAIDEDVADGPSDVVNEPDSPLTCEPDEKVCSNVCVKTDDPGYGCASVSCTPCAIPFAIAVCSGGDCALGTCSANRLDCDVSALNGCEVDALTDPDHCGTCGNACTAPPNMVSDCTAGVCEAPVCVTGFGDCDGAPANGCEAVLSSDPSNCGSCGKTCSYPHAYGECVFSKCQIDVCHPMWGNCNTMSFDGCETDLSTDKTNCGACYNMCSPGQKCLSGVCG